MHVFNCILNVLLCILHVLLIMLPSLLVHYLPKKIIHFGSDKQNLSSLEKKHEHYLQATAKIAFFLQNRQQFAYRLFYNMLHLFVFLCYILKRQQLDVILQRQKTN